jgi:hypothetical protein
MTAVELVHHTFSWEVAPGICVAAGDPGLTSPPRPDREDS